MYLNTIKPAAGSKKAAKRVGRGIGSGVGKTCGRGHKGQKARAGGFHKVGFEGGQMPIQRRLPKFGFTSQLQLVTASIRLDQLAKAKAEQIDINTLKTAGIIKKNIKRVKVFHAGILDKALHLVGIHVTKGALKAIEAAGGKVE